MYSYMYHVNMLIVLLMRTSGDILRRLFPSFSRSHTSVSEYIPCDNSFIKYDELQSPPCPCMSSDGNVNTMSNESASGVCLVYMYLLPSAVRRPGAIRLSPAAMSSMPTSRKTICRKILRVPCGSSFTKHGTSYSKPVRWNLSHRPHDKTENNRLNNVQRVASLVFLKLTRTI